MRRTHALFAAVLAFATLSCNDATQVTSTVPKNVRASIANGTINLTWDAVAGAVNYKVYMASESGVTPVNVGAKAGNMTHPELMGSFPHPDGLDPNTDWYLVVTAVFGDSTESAESCEVRAKIAAALGTNC